MPIRYGIVLLVMAWLLPVGAACAGGCPVLTVTSDAEYPPISWRDKQHPGRIIGVAIELIERATAGSGVSVESKYVGPWKRALRSVEAGRTDLLSGLYFNKERERHLDFVPTAFMNDPVVIFVKKGEPFPFSKWEDLEGRPGGARLGDSFGTEFDRFARERLNLVHVADIQQLFVMLEAGRLQYCVYGLYPGLALAEEGGFRHKLECLPIPVTEQKIYAAFGKASGCREHRGLLKKRFEELVADGLPDRLVEKYLKIWKEQARMP